MKKVFLITFLSVISLNWILGQNQSTKVKNVQFSIGPTVNYNSGSITLGNGNSNNRGIRDLNLSKFNSVGGGILADFKFKNNLFLQTGLLYDTRTVTDTEFVSIDSAPFASSFRLKIAHINVPLIVGYSFGKGSTKPYLSAGLQVGTGTKEEVSNIYEEEIPSYITKNEPDFEFEPAEFSILAEIGIRQHIGQSSLLNLGFQYVGGDKDIFVNRTNGPAAGGAVNLGTKKYAINLSFLFKL